MKKAVNRNSEEVYDFGKEDFFYIEMYGMYGFLILSVNGSIYFMHTSDENPYTCDVTNDFYLIF